MAGLRIIIERKNKAVRVGELTVINAGWLARHFGYKHHQLNKDGWNVVCYGAGVEMESTQRDAETHCVESDWYFGADTIAALIEAGPPCDHECVVHPKKCCV